MNRLGWVSLVMAIKEGISIERYEEKYNDMAYKKKYLSRDTRYIIIRHMRKFSDLSMRNNYR